MVSDPDQFSGFVQKKCISTGPDRGMIINLEGDIQIFQCIKNSFEVLRQFTFKWMPTGNIQKVSTLPASSKSLPPLNLPLSH